MRDPEEDDDVAFRELPPTDVTVVIESKVAEKSDVEHKIIADDSEVAPSQPTKPQLNGHPPTASIQRRIATNDKVTNKIHA